MKRYCYVDRELKNRYGDHNCNIYKFKNNDLVHIANVVYRPGSTPGAMAEVFRKLIEIGEIPKKYYKSSGKLGNWIGDGYFAGEVTEHYNIREIY